MAFLHTSMLQMLLQKPHSVEPLVPLCALTTVFLAAQKLPRGRFVTVPLCIYSTALCVVIIFVEGRMERRKERKGRKERGRKILFDLNYLLQIQLLLKTELNQ